MNDIAFLIADTTMKRSIEHILWVYRDVFRTLPQQTEIEIIDFPRVVEQARDLIRRGAKVIITNSGSHQILLNNHLDVPLFCLYSSTTDVLYTLRQVAQYDKIHLFLNKHFIFDSSACPDDIQKKLVRYPPYSIEDSHDKLLQLLDKVPITPNTAIVGCTLLPQIASYLPMPVYPIRPSESTILSVYQYADELLALQQKDRRQLSLLQSVLYHVDEGIIVYNRDGAISQINRQARRFLHIGNGEQNIGDILPDIFSSSKTPSLYKDKIIQSPPYTLVANAAPFQSDNETMYIAAFRDVTELQRLEKNVRYKLAKTGLTAAHHFDDILTTDKGMQQTIETGRRIASYNAPVLIQGESGTGKELFAQSIHNASPRRNGPFVVVNCAALPPELLESELFGYTGGSFTGARKEGKAGYFELAHGGTIFLDEINSMSANIQSKLLRVLESKEIMRIGSDSVIPLDIRIISASNADIMGAVQSGKFRRDLYFRLNTLTLNLPSLNERPHDIVYLFRHFLRQLSGRNRELPAALQTALQHHHWWGNIRELHSVALRYHIFGDTDDTSYQYLFDQPQEQPPHLVSTDNMHINMKQLQRSVEQLVIEDLLAQGYTKTQIAKFLGISRQTVFNKMKE